MMKILLTFCLVFMGFVSVSGQTLKGRIVDMDGNPVPYATLYIRETAQGIMVDDRGEFQTLLKKGTYSCDISSLGYERKRVEVVMDKVVVTLHIELEKKMYTIREVVVSARQENPAYAIMRKAIAMAPFYLRQVDAYEAEVYMKGTVKVDKLPRLLKARINNKDLKNITDKLFLVESQNLITFKAPNHYEEKILAFSTTVPFDMEASNPMDIMTTNIYDPNMWGRVSPLSPGAFSYYTFALEGMTMEGNHLIYKIRVTPKKKNAKLVSGWLYIIDKSWNVQSADLSGTEMGVTVRFVANYNEVRSLAFLPTAYDIQMKVDIMGVKADAKFNASMQYLNATLNESQGVIALKGTTSAQPVPALPKPKTAKQEKTQKKLEELAAKETLTNREAYKMSKLMQDAVEPEEAKEKRKSLELMHSDANIKVTVDSLAKKRDSLYWAGVRDLPLRREEVESYQKKDSLDLELKGEGQNEITLSTPESPIGKILMGEQVKLSNKYWFRYGGLLGAVPEYNFTDGFWLGQKLTFGADIAKGKSLSISPSAHYTTARKTVNWQIDGTFHYAPFRNGELSISGGNTTADFNRHGTLRLINTLASLFFGENPVKFYQKKFVEASNTIDLANGLTLKTGLAYEKRNALDNRQSYSFFGSKPSSNLPRGQMSPIPTHTSTQANIEIAYTPKYYYWKTSSGRKQYSHSLYPTLMLYYQTGIAGNSSTAASYSRLETMIKQEIKFNLFDKLDYTINVGKFLESKRLYFPDYKHFSTNDFFLSGSNIYSTFSLLDNYKYSADNQWLQAFVNYSSSYLLLKNLPFLQNYLFDEAFHVRTLCLPSRNYTEAGYSLGFPGIARAGVFVSFDKGKYDATGFTLSLPFLSFLFH